MSMIRHCDKCGKALVGEGRKFQHFVVQGRDIDICEDNCLKLFFEWIKEKPVVKTTDIPSKNWTNKPVQEKPATIVVGKPKLPTNAEKDPVTTFKNTGEVKSIEQTNLKQSKSVQRREEIQKTEEHLGLNDMIKFVEEHAGEIFPENIQVRERDGKEYIEDVSKRILTCFKKKLVKKGITTEKIFIEKCSTLDRWISIMDYNATVVIKDSYSEVYFRILRIMKTEGYPINRLQELELRNHDNPDDDIEIKRTKFSTKRQHA